MTLPKQLQQAEKDLEEGRMPGLPADLAENMANTGEGTAGDGIENPSTEALDPDGNPLEPTPEGSPTEPNLAAGEETWQQRFNVMEGKYKAELPPLRTRIAELEESERYLNSQNFVLQKRVEELETVPAAPEQPKLETVEDLMDFDPQTLSGYGSEFVDLGNAFKQGLQKILGKVSTVQNTVGEVQQTTKNNDERTYQNNLVAAVNRLIAEDGGSLGDFVALNGVPERNVPGNPDFVKYLNEIPLGGTQSRMAPFKTAHKDMNLPAVEKVFRDFINKQKEVPVKTDNSDPVKDLTNVSPSPAQGAPNQPVTKAQGQQYQKAWADKFVRDYATGSLPLNLRENAEAIFQDIQQARIDGRIMG